MASSSLPGVTVASLGKGLLVLVALLVVVGLLGGVGSIELLIWVVLLAVWVTWWTLSRKAPSRR